MRATAVRDALRERNVRLLVGSGSVDALGNGMAQVALAFAVLQIGGVADLGYTFLAREIPMVVFLLLGGIWADRVSRKVLLVAGDLAMGSAQVLTALLFLTHHATVWRVALLQMVFGVSNAFTRPASTGLIPQAVSIAHLQEATALTKLGARRGRGHLLRLGGVLRSPPGASSRRVRGSGRSSRASASSSSRCSRRCSCLARSLRRLISEGRARGARSSRSRASGRWSAACSRCACTRDGRSSRRRCSVSRSPACSRCSAPRRRWRCSA